MITVCPHRFVLIAFILGIAIQNGVSKYLLVHLGEDGGMSFDNGRS